MARKKRALNSKGRPTNKRRHAKLGTRRVTAKSGNVYSITVTRLKVVKRSGKGATKRRSKKSKAKFSKRLRGK